MSHSDFCDRCDQALILSHRVREAQEKYIAAKLELEGHQRAWRSYLARIHDEDESMRDNT